MLVAHVPIGRSFPMIPPVCILPSPPPASRRRTPLLRLLWIHMVTGCNWSFMSSSWSWGSIHDVTVHRFLAQIEIIAGPTGVPNMNYQQSGSKVKRWERTTRLFKTILCRTLCACWLGAQEKRPSIGSSWGSPWLLWIHHRWCLWWTPGSGPSCPTNWFGRPRDGKTWNDRSRGMARWFF